jgi:glycosyltransferase involved in cell wall biosynthesis
MTFMPCPTVNELPLSPCGKTGWPWTEGTPPISYTEPCPTVSIITPSFNQAAYIEETIRSVLLQNYQALEYIIIDGGSTDGTLDILRRYERWVQWVSEPDRGQTDAINKGMRLARGEVLAYLNSDDTYLPGAIDTVAHHLATHPEVGLVYGDCFAVNTDGVAFGTIHGHSYNLRRMIMRGEFVPQQAAFWSRQVMDLIGLFDANLHYCMDHDYFIRTGQHFAVHYIPQPLATFRFHASSKTVSHQELHWHEVMSVCRHYGMTPWTIWFYIRLIRHWGLRALPKPLQTWLRVKMARPQDPYLLLNKHTTLDSSK